MGSSNPSNASVPPGSVTLTDTARTEALSDGVFAIVITLLVLNLEVPPHAEGEMLHTLLDNWPAYAAFLASFVYVGIIWLNHHSLFKRIASVTAVLNGANLGLLLGAVIIPFPTEALASAFSEGNMQDQRAAVVLYGLAGTIMSASWLALFYVLHRAPRLLKAGVPASWPRRQFVRPATGIVLYAACAIAGWLLSPIIGVAAIGAVIVYHALTSQGVSG